MTLGTPNKSSKTTRFPPRDDSGTRALQHTLPPSFQANTRSRQASDALESCASEPKY
jgi:hypothetical protein